jgi:hypothetical protein
MPHSVAISQGGRPAGRIRQILLAAFVFLIPLAGNILFIIADRI